MNRRTLMRQNLRRSVQPTNPNQGQVSRSVVTKEKNKEQIKQRAIKEMTKTWESSTNISKDSDKNTGFRRIANLALQKYKASLSHAVSESIEDNQTDYEQPFQIKKIKDPKSDEVSDYYTFNREYFDMSRSKMLPSKCRKICLKDPAERTHDEILAMRSYMIGLKSFELYPPRMQNALCRVVRFEAFGRGRVIVRFGAIGSSMYFISFGKVGITKDPRGDGVFTQAEPILIERGGCFGEVALANKCTRTATVVCMEYTELLVIDKEDFDNLKLDRFIHLEQDARRQCFQSITPISNFPYADHLMLAQTTRTAFYPINTVIKKSDTLSDYTYFVVRGIIEIFRVIELNECEEYHRQTQKRYYGRTFKMNSGPYKQNHKIVVKIAKRGKGEYFALEEKESSPYTIVSQGATVVRITNGVLQDLKMHDSLMKYQSRIPDQQEIIDHFNQQNEWNFYKKGIVNYHFTRKMVMKARARGKMPKIATIYDHQNDKAIISLANRNKTQSEYIHGIHLPLFESQQFQRQYI